MWRIAMGVAEDKLSLKKGKWAHSFATTVAVGLILIKGTQYHESFYQPLIRYLLIFFNRDSTE
jgi:hypothetical protein